MSKIALKAGKVVRDSSGRIILCDDCPCEEGVITDCCPDDGLPEELHGTWTTDGTWCACLAGDSITLTRIPASSTWAGTLSHPAHGCPGFTSSGSIGITCSLVLGVPRWTLSYGAGHCVTGDVAVVTAFACNPFMVSFRIGDPATGTGPAICCGDGFGPLSNVFFVVTE